MQSYRAIEIEEEGKGYVRMLQYDYCNIPETT